MAEAGKGSRPRPFSVTQKEYASNWDAIFRKKEKQEQKQEQDETKQENNKENLS